MINESKVYEYVGKHYDVNTRNVKYLIEVTLEFARNNPEFELNIDWCVENVERSLEHEEWCRKYIESKQLELS